MPLHTQIFRYQHRQRSGPIPRRDDPYKYSSIHTSVHTRKKNGPCRQRPPSSSRHGPARRNSTLASASGLRGLAGAGDFSEHASADSSSIDLGGSGATSVVLPCASSSSEPDSGAPAVQHRHVRRLRRGRVLPLRRYTLAFEVSRKEGEDQPSKRQVREPCLV
jgi:hypothetical protein